MVDLDKKFDEFCDALPNVFDDDARPITPAERRIIFVVDGKKMAEEWSGHFNEEFFDESVAAIVKDTIKGFLTGFFVISGIKRQIDNKKRDKFIDKYFKYPIITIENALEHFQFPTNHPQHDTLYAMCDIMPNDYVPLSIFHEYIEQMKYSSFMELCAALGAKEIYYETDDTNNKSLNINASSDTPLENINVGTNRNKNTNLKLAIEFTEKNTVIKDYQSKWLDTEPTWKSMKKMRIENHVKSFIVEYNYTDDFGINASVAANVKGFGFNIGGEFNEMKMKKLKYNVIFWEI